MKRLHVLTTASLLIAIVAIGGTVWIVTEPQRWFKDRYAADADASSRLDDVEFRLDQVESDVSTSKTTSGTRTVT